MMNWLSSFSVNYPLALLGVASILLPIIIHLLSKSRGKIVPISNIKLIKPVKTLKVREFKLQQWGLLLLRIAILVLACLLLAKLSSDHLPSQQPNTVLVTQDWLNQSSVNEKTKLTAEHVNDQIFLLKNNAKSLTNQEITHWKVDSYITPKPRNIWYLVKQQLLQFNNITAVYTTNRASEFSGKRFDVTSAVNWQVLPLPMVRTRLLPNIKNILVLYDSDRANDNYQLGRAFSLLNDHGMTHANTTFSSRENFVDISQYNTEFQWVFYLSSKPIPTSMLTAITSGTKVFIDAETPSKQSLDEWQLSTSYLLSAMVNVNIYGNHPLVASLISETDKPTSSLGSISQTNISPKNISQKDNAQPNQQLLREYQIGDGKLLLFSSRFSPQWSNFLALDTFPYFLQELLLDAPDLTPYLTLTNEIIENKKRNEQAIPELDGTQPAKTNLEQYVICLLILLWALERLISENVIRKSAKRKIHSSTQLNTNE